MTRTVRKTICALVIGVFLLVSLGALAWATDGFVNWKASSWFNYWGKGSPIVVVDNNTPGTPEASAYVGARNVGLTYDSDESTYAVTKLSMPVVNYNYANFDDFLNRNFTFYTYSRGTGFELRVSVLSKNDTVLKSYTAVPGEGVVIPLSEILSLTNDELVKFSAYVASTSANYADSDTLSKAYYISHLEYTTPDDTVINIPRFNVGNYTAKYEIVAFDCSPNEPINTVGHTFESSNTISPSQLNNCTKVSNSTAVTSTNAAYTVNLAGLSFASQYNDVNTVAVLPYIGSDSVTYNGVTVDGFILDCVPFYFSISQLAAPSNINFANGKLTWNAVENAQGYMIIDGDNQWSTNIPEFDIFDKSLEVGEHMFRIRALGNMGAALSTNSITVTAFNASAHVTQLVALTYDIEGDTVTKFVPQGKSMSDYLYEVDMPGKEFGGWYYDTGYSLPVTSQDKLDKDITIYARLSDVQVVERQLTWWELHKWQVLIPCFVLGGLIVLAAVAVTVKKKKKH